MQNSIPPTLGAITVFGMVVDDHYVILGTSIVVLVTCALVMIGIIRNCRARNKLLNNLKARRSKHDVNSTCG